MRVIIVVLAFLLISRTVNAQYTTYNAYGDSITQGTGASIPANAYISLIGADKSVSVVNRGYPSRMACDLGSDALFPQDSPSTTDHTIRTIMIGTNDANTKGAGTYEAVYTLCLEANISWLATPSAAKTVATSCSQTGTWSADNTYYVSGLGLQSTTSGSTLSCALTTAGKPIYIWYLLCDACGGIFTYAVDAATPVSVNNTTSPPIASQVGGTHGVGVIRVPVNAGSHTVHLATTSSNLVSILGAGTTSASCCVLLVGGIIRQASDANSAATAAYDADVQTAVSLLQGDSLPISYAPTRYYVNTTTDMYDGLHPNDTGHRHLANAFETVWPCP